jgi:hypothetical protein
MMPDSTAELLAPIQPNHNCGEQAVLEAAATRKRQIIRPMPDTAVEAVEVTMPEPASTVTVSEFSAVTTFHCSAQGRTHQLAAISRTSQRRCTSSRCRPN